MTCFLSRTKKTAFLKKISEVSGRFILWLSMLIIIRWTPCSLSHAARYSERSSDSGQNADGYLKNCFPRHNFSVEC